LVLSACDSDAAGDEPTAQAKPSGEQTVAGALAGAEDLSTVSSAMSDAGLASVFEGIAPYTILAPQDSAFAALGESGTELRQPEQRAAIVAILRDHIVPGYLTPKDIAAAIDRASGNGAKMRTMGGHIVTFARDGDAITVLHEDGSTARLVSEALITGNGVVLPISAVLKMV
jgi:uncharacterized surface protein with fasciclin (FAS1) repeats